VAAFAQKLESWGQELPEAERAVLELLLARAEGGDFEVGDVSAYTFTAQPFSRFVLTSLSPLASVSLRAAGDPWVEIGPIWQQKGGIQSNPGLQFRQLG
jgi:hypothetical protein